MGRGAYNGYGGGSQFGRGGLLRIIVISLLMLLLVFMLLRIWLLVDLTAAGFEIYLLEGELEK